MLHCLILFTYQKNYHFAHFNYIYIYIYSGVGCYVQTKNSYLILNTTDRTTGQVPLYCTITT